MTAPAFTRSNARKKYLKAPLQEAGLAFPKTHDLLGLLNRLLTVEAAWTTLNPQLTQLVSYAVAFRYPGVSASKADARKALAACRAVRRAVRQSLKLKD